MKGHRKRGHICTNHGEPETLQGTPEHEWAGEAQTARRPGKCTAAAAGGNQGRVANREWEKSAVRKSASAVRKVDTLH